jgi:hypothetical protein
VVSEKLDRESSHSSEKGLYPELTESSTRAQSRKAGTCCLPSAQTEEHKKPGMDTPPSPARLPGLDAAQHISAGLSERPDA